jgi:hypothetical protein
MPGPQGPTAPNVTGRSKRSTRTTTIQATACSRRGQYRCIKAETEIEKQLLSHGHQTAQQQSLNQRLLPTLRPKSLDTLINGSRVTLNNATLNHFYISYITHITCIYCILYHLLHLAYAARPSIYLYVHILIHHFRFGCIR